MRLVPDDPIWRIRAVWLGPKGMTFWFEARYLAWAVWLGLFLLILLVEAITPLPVHVIPVWEICIAVGATYGVMVFVDHERTIGSIWRTFIVDLTSPRVAKRVVHRMAVRSKRVRVPIQRGLL